MIYFVSAGRQDEVRVIQNLRPTHLLLSYFHFKNKSIQSFIDQIDYQPKILLDSGAYTAWNTGKNIALLDYIRYIKENQHLVETYIALDVIDSDLGDEFSKRYYDMMLLAGLDPVPVFHEGDDLSYLKYYVDSEPPFIALGGTAQNKNKPFVRDWVKSLQDMYPNQPFHLLGSSSKQIINQTNLRSYDASTWILMASNGYPKDIPGKSIEAKRARMYENMKMSMEELK